VIARVGLLLLLAITALCPAAAADSELDARLTPQAVAERLFQEGKSLMEAGDPGRACPKLMESHRIDPAGGTVLLLALCLEARGLLASAWTRYHEAQSLARRDQRLDRLERAAERLRALEPRLSRIHLRPPPSAPAGLEIAIDATRLPPSAYESGLPLDPGEHRVSATAPDHEPWSASVVVRGEGDVLRVNVPPLRRTDRRRELAPAPGSRLQNDIGLAVAGAGAASLVAAMIAGGVALHRDSRADRLCPEVECLDARAVHESTRAREAASAATYATVAGVSLLAAGLVLVWTSGPSTNGSRDHLHAAAPAQRARK
jgi:hypothetical protein